MTQLVQALGVLLPVAYLLAALGHGVAMERGKDPAAERFRRATMAGALLLHLASFAVRYLDTGHFPIAGGWMTLSAIAFTTALIYAWIAHRLAQHGTGIVVLGLVFLMQLAASAMGPLAVVPASNLSEGFYALHVTTSIAAVATLALSGVHGLLYLLAFRALRKRRFGPLMAHIPSLQHLAQFVRSAALAGFILLGIGVNAGIWWAHAEGVAGFSYGDAWVIAMLAVWLHFGAVAFSRAIPGFSARRASFAAAAGLVVLLTCYVILQIPSLSSFHWKA
jgi:ABC-type uncharacterized transport system permease subunit